MTRRLSFHIETWPLRAPFRIATRTHESLTCLVVELTEGSHTGRGEGIGIHYVGDTIEPMTADLIKARAALEAGAGRADLPALIPSRGARNAVDCALWDLECKMKDCTIWDLTGITPKAQTTVYTIGIEDSPEAMAEKARQASEYPHLKIKLDADRPVEKIVAIRAARPDASLVIDANQGFTMEALAAALPGLAGAGIDMVEQPLPRGGDAALQGFSAPLPLCADESCFDRTEMAALPDGYSMINIKLDKTGGLTEGLALARQAREEGKRVMVGNMLGTSLSMAPAFVVAQLCDFVDLDGPLLFHCDRPGGLGYDGGTVSQAPRGFWG